MAIKSLATELHFETFPVKSAESEKYNDLIVLPVEPLTLIREFLGPSPSAFSAKKSSTGTYTNYATLRSGFFPENALGDGPAFWTFFQDSRIRVKFRIFHRYR